MADIQSMVQHLGMQVYCWVQNNWNYASRYCWEKPTDWLGCGVTIGLQGLCSPFSRQDYKNGMYGQGEPLFSRRKGRIMQIPMKSFILYVFVILGLVFFYMD